MTPVTPEALNATEYAANENAEGVMAWRCKRLQGPVLGAVERADLPQRVSLLAVLVVRAALANGRLHLVTRNQENLGRLLRWTGAEVHKALYGGQDRGAQCIGILETGIISMKRDGTGGRGAVCFTVQPNWSRWTVSWRYGAGAWGEMVAGFNGEWGELTRQLKMAEIEERFELSRLVMEQDVDQALALSAGDRETKEDGLSGYRDEVAPNGVFTSMTREDDRRPDGERAQASPVAPNGVWRGDGRVSGADVARPLAGASEGSTGGTVRRSCTAAVAPNGVCPVTDDPGDAGSYRFDNFDLPAKSGKLSNREVPRARPIGELESGFRKLTNYPNWSIPIGKMDSDMIEVLKAKINGDEREFCWAAGVIIGHAAWRVGGIGRRYGDGLVWRLRWEHKPGRELCRRVYLDAVANRSIMREPAGYVTDLWARWGGQAHDRERFAARQKNLKESFLST